MKQLIIFFALFLLGLEAQAQTCKIKIYYDANGNRILRVKECNKPAPDESTSIAEPTDLVANYQVYPNPAENKVNIKLDADLLAKGCNIFMTDISGRMLFQKVNVAQAVSVIDLQGYTDGTYFIAIVQDNIRHTVKIVKQTGSGY